MDKRCVRACCDVVVFSRDRMKRLVIALDPSSPQPPRRWQDCLSDSSKPPRFRVIESVTVSFCLCWGLCVCLRVCTHAHMCTSLSLSLFLCVFGHLLSCQLLRLCMNYVFVYVAVLSTLGCCDLGYHPSDRQVSVVLRGISRRINNRTSCQTELFGVWEQPTQWNSWHQ